MQAETIETVYSHFITRKDVRITYRARDVVAAEPVFNGSLYRIHFSETESIVVASTAVCTVQIVHQKGKR